MALMNCIVNKLYFWVEAKVEAWNRVQQYLKQVAEVTNDIKDDEGVEEYGGKGGDNLKAEVFHY